MTTYSLGSHALGVFVLAALITGCATTVKKTESSLADQQLTFATPQEALQALREAASSGNKQELTNLFGPAAKEFIDSGDAVADAESIKKFSLALQERTALTTVSIEEQGKPKLAFADIMVGSHEWPFPVPLFWLNGRWQFDGAFGKDEIIARRIGENELRVLSVCSGYVEAQKEYFSAVRKGNNVRQYAARLFSTPGKEDGLYWDTVSAGAKSPMGPFVAKAEAEGYKLPDGGKSEPYHGYFFRILTAQGKNARGGEKNYLVNRKMTAGFAMLAYPAKWDESGIMTFMVGPDGVVYEKNLGPDTTGLAAKISSYNPDPSWRPAGKPSKRS